MASLPSGGQACSCDFSAIPLPLCVVTSNLVGLGSTNTNHRKTHSAPLTTLFLSIQDVPGMNPADPLGCLYLSIQIESVFIYSYHIRTHSRRRITSPYRSIMTSNVFVYDTIEKTHCTQPLMRWGDQNLIPMCLSIATI